MDNFKIPKQKHRSRHPSVDGIVGSKKSNVKPTSGLVGDFKQKEGFHPYQQSKVGISKDSSSTIGEDLAKEKDEIVELQEKVKKRRFLGRFSLRRKKDKPKKRNIKKRIFITSGVLLILLLLVGGYLGYRLYRTQKQVLTGGGHAVAVCDGTIPTTELHKEGDSRVNVLLVGVGGPGHDGPDLTDTLIIASIDTINKKIDLLSIPRDLWVQNSSGGSNKINAIYPFAKQASTATKIVDKDKAGLKVLDSKITQITGIDIHYNVLVNFKAFKETVNAVGGVTVDVPETLYDPTIAWENNYNPTIASKGVQKFDGPKALLYAKSRETSSDFARGERQRLLLVAIKDKVLSLGTYSNPIRISKILSSFGNNVYSDFDLASVKCLYKQISDIPSSSIKSLDMVKPPHDLLTTGPIGGQSTVFPKAGLYDYSAIKLFVGSTLRDSELAKENARVVVLNGTNNAGLATTKANVLKSYGYRVTKVGDAPTKNYPHTIVVDLTGGVDTYTRHYLEKRYGVSAVNDLPDKKIMITKDQADFVIIIGQNESIVSQN